jgi:acyl-CoA thioesterase
VERNETRLTRTDWPGQRAAVGNAFSDGTQVRALGEGRYEAVIDELWTLRPLPQGGFVTALALRAMEDALEHPDQTVRTAHTTFVSPVAHGVVIVDVEVLRRGRSMSHVRAEVRNPGSDHGHVTTAVFGQPRDGFAFTDLAPPDPIPAPATCPSFRDPPPPEAEPFTPMRFWEEAIEGRPVLGHAPWEDYEPDGAERAMWYRFDETPMLDDGRLDPYAVPVLVDTMPGAVSEKVGPAQRRDWWAPSVDLTVHWLEPCRSPWVLAHNRARHAGEGYASVDQALWDCGADGEDEPRLVAYATQICIFSFPA